MVRTEPENPFAQPLPPNVRSGDHVVGSNGQVARLVRYHSRLRLVWPEDYDAARKGVLTGVACLPGELRRADPPDAGT